MENKSILKIAIFLSAVVLLPVNSHADDSSTSESKVKIEDVSGTSNKTPGEDVDQLITNKKMRAESGSKSRFSIASQFNYLGGTLEKPFAEDRPDISKAFANTPYSLLQGAISGKYNIDNQRSVMAGFGVRYLTPFSGVQNPGGYKGDKIDADNPYLIGQYLYRFQGIQNQLQIQPMLFTDSDLVKAGYRSALTVSQASIYEVGTTGLSLGLYGYAQVLDYTHVKADQSDFGFGIDPFMEYQLSDRYNLRTVFNIGNYDHMRNGFLSLEPMVQSVGVGISVTRDIYLYPNVQFILNNIRMDQTNVALNTDINIF